MAIRRKRKYKFSGRADMAGGAQKHVRRRPKLKFFVILGGALVVAVVLMVLVLRGQPTAAIEWASTEYTADFDMLIVRSEVVYEANDYSKTDFIAEEGQHVEVGDPIVEVYAPEYTDETLSKLLDLQKTILDYEINVSRAGVIDPDLQDIDSRIDAQVKDIQAAVTGSEPQKLLGYERNLETILEERATYMKNVVEADETLRGYYTEEQTLLDQIAQWSTEITAQESGVVSFYFDGCESLMTKENIGSFTKKALEEVSEGKTIETTGADQGTAPLYRVVNENEWYAVLLTEKKIPEMYEGNAFSIVFDDYLDTQYSGVVYNATTLENNDGFVYTILIQDNIGPLLGERRVSAKLYSTQEGMRVPASCVKSTDDVDYVQTADGQNVPVLVVADDGQYVFIQTYQGQASLELGQRLKE